MRRKVTLRAKLLTLFLSPIVLLGLLEAALRISGFSYDPRREASAEDFGEFGEAHVFAPHPRYLWTARPDERISETKHGFLDVRTNSLGLRGPEIPPPGPADELRILCLGDSITFGIGLREGETWPDHARRVLSVETGRPVTVVNAGLPGWGSLQGMRLYRDLRPGGEFDFVVFWFGMNDAKLADGGIPDSWYRSEESTLTAAADLLSRSRVFQLVEYAVYGLRGAASDRSRRVSAREFRAAIDDLRADETEGGPVTIFIRCPERLDETIREFEAMVTAAREYGVSRLAGPAGLFNPYWPYAGGARPVGRIVHTDLGPTLLFGEATADLSHTELATVEAALAELRAWEEKLDEYGDLLPEDRLGAAELLGDLPSPLAFLDNCHLTPLGARRAGEAIAREILRRLER